MVQRGLGHLAARERESPPPPLCNRVAKCIWDSGGAPCRCDEWPQWVREHGIPSTRAVALPPGYHFAGNVCLDPGSAVSSNPSPAEPKRERRTGRAHGNVARERRRTHVFLAAHGNGANARTRGHGDTAHGHGARRAPGTRVFPARMRQCVSRNGSSCAMLSARDLGRARPREACRTFEFRG